jgi:hypothetical protein
VRIKGRDIAVAATIEHVDSMSAHADAVKSCAGCQASRAAAA